MTDHLPVVSWSGVVNVPSSATGTVTAAGGAGGEAPGAAAGAPSAGPSYVALTETLVAFVVVPWMGIAPFSTVDPSAGWSTVSVGTSMSANGTVMTIWAVSSDCLPVSGSVAQTLNWFLPRRRSTGRLHVPSAPAVVRVGVPETSIVTVPLGIVVPRRT